MLTKRKYLKAKKAKEEKQTRRAEKLEEKLERKRNKANKRNKKYNLWYINKEKKTIIKWLRKGNSKYQGVYYSYIIKDLLKNLIEEFPFLEISYRIYRSAFSWDYLRFEHKRIEAEFTLEELEGQFFECAFCVDFEFKVKE